MNTSKFIGAVLAGSLAITSTFSAPAAASSETDKIAKILLGAAAVGFVVHNIKKNRNRAPVAQYDAYPQQPQHVSRRRAQPHVCLRQRYTKHGWETYYSQRCLKRQKYHRYNSFQDVRNHGHHNNGRYHRHSEK